MKTPLIFFGHGSPMNALESNNFTNSWGAMGRNILEKPRALLIFSAHWITEGETRINTTEKPEILYDVYGFPEELYKTRYDVPGSSRIAGEIIGMLAGKYGIVGDKNHGIDHGVWSTLIHAFPDADIPVIQMSLDSMRSPQWHFAFGKSLSQLREQGILIIGSGNIVHNLRAIDWSGTNIYPWAVEFDQRVAKDILGGNYTDILDFESWESIRKLAHPTDDHLLPLFPLLGLVGLDERATFFTPEIAMGSLSMRSVVWK